MSEPCQEALAGGGEPGAPPGCRAAVLFGELRPRFGAAWGQRGAGCVQAGADWVRASPRSLFPPPADDPIRLLREVVLLTDDRNLRVKALTRNVPVRDIPTFLKWAQEG